MKKTFFSVVLLMASTMAFAQVKSVKEAKTLADGGKFEQAEKLINEALTNDETKNQAATWDVAGDIQKKIAEEQNTNAYLKKAYDEAKWYNAVYKMFNYYSKCDELEQLPDEKGKVKNKFGKENGATMKTERGNLINGGVYYFNQGENEQAYNFFSMYIDSANSPLLAKENLAATDTFMTMIAYYASLAAIKIAQDNQDNEAVRDENYRKALKYTALASQDKENGKYGQEFEATAYKALGDTVNWLNTLKSGIEKFPDHPFFFGHLVDYYSNSGKYDEALEFANGMIQKNGESSFYLYVLGYLYQNKKDYDQAIEAYKKAVQLDPTNAEAYSNLGLSYCQQGLEYGEKATSDLNDPNYQAEQDKIKKFYEEARPYYEKARELKPDSRNLWLNGLYTIYYKLNLGAEFQEIEALMNN